MAKRSRKISYPGGINSPLSKIKEKMIIARVTDIILNPLHPGYDELDGWSSIGTIFYETFDKVGSNNNTIAKPFFPQISYFPIINELVLLFSLPNRNMGSNVASESYYYINMVNIWNSPHHNAYPNPIAPNDPAPPQKDYKQIEGGSPIREIDEDGTQINLNYTKYPNRSQDTFIERPNIHPLLPYAGDMIYQGRWGNSIRFGSTARPKPLGESPNLSETERSQLDERYKTHSLALNPWSSVGKNGDPIIMIRNGQSTLAGDKGWIPIIEDIQTDLSSIYRTSTQKIPIEPSVGKNVLDYSSYQSSKTPILCKEFNKPQIIINSDRLVFNAEEDNILMSAKESIFLGSKSSVNFKSKQIVLESVNIRLGDKEADQSLIKGDLFLGRLENVMKNLLVLCKQLKSIKDWSTLDPLDDKKVKGSSKPALNAICNALITSIENSNDSGFLDLIEDYKSTAVKTK